jgi:hypothetical protein
MELFSDTQLSVTRVVYPNTDKYLALICRYADNEMVYQICDEHVTETNNQCRYAYTNFRDQVVRDATRQPYDQALREFRRLAAQVVQLQD